MQTYAVIAIGGKQYRVREGERLLVDRVPTEEGKTFAPQLLMLRGDGGPDFGTTSATVTARVVGHVKGEKIRIGKYRPKKGYKRHTGFRASLTQIEIEAIGQKAKPVKAAERPAKAEKAAPRAANPPKGYEELTVAEIKDQAAAWRRPQLEAALAYEREHGNRKGAIAALEAAIAAKESD